MALNIILILFIFVTTSYADLKVSEMTEITTPQSTDYLKVIRPSGSSYVDRKISYENFSVSRFDQIQNPNQQSGIEFNGFSTVWTSTTGTHLWTSAVTSGDSFTIVNNSNYDNNSSVLKLAQTGNPNGGAVLRIINTDANVDSISANNFRVDQAGKIYVNDNTSGKLLIADGLGYSPQSMSGACTITSSGVTTCSATSTVSVDSTIISNPNFISTGDIDFVATGSNVTANLNSGAIRYDQLGNPNQNKTINFSTFNNIWTSTTGTNLWTSAIDSGPVFQISNIDTDASAELNLLRLSLGSGSDTEGNFIKATDANGIQFTVGKNGLTTIGNINSVSYIQFQNGFTADPCTSSGTGDVPINSIFRNSTANELCVCNNTGVDLRIKDYSTSCF